MVKVRFENVNIYRNATESKEFCFAYMVIKDEQIPVQLQKASNGDWVAINLNTHTLYHLLVIGEKSFEDWLDGSEAEVYVAIPK